MVKIICEGSSDKNKIAELLGYLEINYREDNFIIMGNKNNIFQIGNNKYKTLKELMKAEKIEKIFFIVDADYKKDNNKYGGYENTQNELRKLINNLKIENKSDFFISCNPTTKDGYLESLLLSTVDENLKKCYDEFLNCIEFEEKNKHKYMIEQLHKLTSPQKPYNFSNDNFNELKEKLIKLFK